MDQVIVDGILQERQAHSTTVQQLAFVKNDNCVLEELDLEGKGTGYCLCFIGLGFMDADGRFSDQEKEFRTKFDPDFAAQAPHP